MTRKTIPNAVTSVLEILEQYNANNQISRVENYKTMQSILDRDEIKDAEIIRRLLATCNHDINTTMYSACVVNMISTIVSKVKMGTYDPAPDLLPSALAVLSLLKKIALFNKVEFLMVLSYRSLLSYPENILVEVADKPEEIMEILQLYCHIRMPLSPKLEAYAFLLKLLQILPQEKKRFFVEKGLTIWFSKVIPMIIFDMKGSNGELRKLTEIFELLTDELVHIDYADNPNWHGILECICDNKQYPAIMKELLNSQNDIWCRLWITFTRLLKHQVTQTVNGIGSPINSMLPVVEIAFKLDAKSRCYAFECWIALIDSFSRYSSESKIAKTMNLLLIPLKANNAKTPEIVLAKFKCWWHLLRKFQNKMDKFHNKVLDYFIKSYFGRHDSIDNTETVSGLFTDHIRKLYNQAIVDMVGHVNCEGCTELPPLNGKIINTQNLVDNWNQWIFTLTLIFKSLNTDYGLTKQQATCLWKSLNMTIAELPENNVRKDLFDGLISHIRELLKNCNCDTHILDIVFNVLLTLFDEDAKIRRLFKSDSKAIIQFIKIILDDQLHIYYKSLVTRELVTKFNAITSVIFDEDISCVAECIMDELLNSLPLNNIGLLLWTALAQLLCKSNNTRHIETMPHKLFLWPLKSIQMFTEVKIPAMTWYTTYNSIYPKLKYDMSKEISVHLCAVTDNSSSSVYFKLCVVLAILKYNSITGDNTMACKNELYLLQNLTTNMNKYEDFGDIWQMLVERLVAIMTIVTSDVNEIVTPLVLISLKNVLIVLTETYENRVDVSHVSVLIKDLLETLDKILSVEAYFPYLLCHVPNMTCDLLKCFTLLSAHLPTHTVRLSILKKILGITDNKDANYNEAKSLIDVIEGDLKKGIEIDQKSENIKIPHTKEIPTRTKTKEANIVKTVVENGEEYVVVKSNWKFNPKKLTENQKEKLQRKREDIPALYQDLSQSQDEFKLVSWKTDSVDNTSSSRSESNKSSKPTYNESASEILKNLSSPNVVPTILENIISENNLNSSNNILPKDTKNVALTPVIIPKNNKTPRMALKDRVFRNVRNLIENSGFHKENEASSEGPIGADNNSNSTHAKRNKLESVIHSAPPLLSADRPSRMKRKPKKFDDSLLLLCKRNRSSLYNIHSNSDEIEENTTDTCTPTPNSNSLHNDIVNNMDISSTSKSVRDTDGEVYNKIGKKEEKLPNIQETDRKDNFSKKDLTKNCSAVKTKEKLSIQPLSPDNDILTEGAPKDLDNLKGTSPCKELTKEVSLVSSDLIQMSTPKSSRDQREMSSIASRDAKVILTPRTHKVVKDISFSNSPEIVKDQSTLNTPKVIPKRASVIPKPGSKSKASGEVDKLSSSKVSKCVSIPKKSKDDINISTHSVHIALNDISTPPQDDEDLTLIPASLKDGKEMSTEQLRNDQVGLDISNDIEKSACEQIKMSLAPTTSTHSNETSTPKESENAIEGSLTNVENDVKEVLSTNQTNENNVSTFKQSPQNKSTVKKSKTRKARIEKELAIDMVEGHPFLKIQSERRLTRKSLESVGVGRRKSNLAKLNKPQSDNTGASSVKNTNKTKGRPKESTSPSSDGDTNNIKIKDAASYKQSSLSDDLPSSEDIIESSQDSTITTISVKSSKAISKKIPVVCIEKIVTQDNKIPVVGNSQSVLECENIEVNQPICADQEINDDIMLPLNKTLLDETQGESMLEDKDQDNHTANMDTEPLDNTIRDDIFIVSDEVPEVRKDCIVDLDTQKIAEADTQPTDITEVMDIGVLHNVVESSNLYDIKEGCDSENCNTEKKMQGSVVKLVDLNTANKNTDILPDSVCTDIEKSNIASSPFKDEAQRQQDFLNNTVEISPIKTMSPDRDKKSPSPETSNDYVVITLTSPVHSNGEPFEKCSSPEVFTDDKVSPDKRDQSPPRSEVILTNTSPSSSLSLKKNKPQVRSGGRAAQMLGLCVPDNLHTVVNPEKDEPEEIKRGPNNIPAKRNLRILYNSVNENTDVSNSIGENDDKSNFLKFRRSLPAVDSSPSGSILKRKLVEITDDAMISPASKRKRVSFHDPPVSTTISVQKYIEPGIRSPQNSALKRQERQLRQRTHMKSLKKLENVFKLDTVLTNTVESFSKSDMGTADDTQPLSLDETPVVEVIRPSDLNDTDPICPELIDCQDSIENIAGELSSSAMKLLLVKELEGKVETVGDLAKMTEFEVNRLCIKAPKVKVAKQVLLDYMTKRTVKDGSMVLNTIETEMQEAVSEPMTKCQNNGVQTDSTETMDVALQTVEIASRVSSMQTEEVSIAHASIQTNESGVKSTADVIQSCISERPDFVTQLGEHLGEAAITQLIDKLFPNSVTELLLKKIGPSDVNRVLENVCNSKNDSSKELSFISDYLCASDKFAPEDLILFCSVLLKSAHCKLSKKVLLS